MLKGITSQQPGVEISDNQHFGGGGGGCCCHHCRPVSGIFGLKLNVS
jgi:hypothetical protein